MLASMNVQRNRWQRLLPVMALLMVGSLWPVYASYLSIEPAGPSRLDPAASDKYAQPASLPLWFEQNSGQAGPEVDFLGRGPGRTLAFTRTGVVIALDSRPSAPMTPEGMVSEEIALGPGGGPTESAPGLQSIARLQFIAPNPATSLDGESPSPGKVNYLLGNDPTKWRTGLPAYSAITYHDLYAGIS